jgi:hypothetical protein
VIWHVIRSRISVHLRHYVTTTQQIAKSCEPAGSCHLSSHPDGTDSRMAQPGIDMLNTSVG